MLRNKAQVCNVCRKVIVYTATQAGTSLPCPHCGERTNLPAEKDFHPEPQKNPMGKALAILAALAIFGGTGAWAVLSFVKDRGHIVNNLPPSFSKLVNSNKASAPNAAIAKGVRAEISVPEVTYANPQIFQAALKKADPTERPVCCIRVEIKNTGKTRIPFHSWRIFESCSSDETATLVDSMMAKLSLVSFGCDSFPVGACQKTEIAPGEKASDIIMFFSKDKPTYDLTLSLPCSNVGGNGRVYFTIPASMIQ